MTPSAVLEKAFNVTLVEASLSNEERRERREAIRNNPSLIKGLGALAIHNAVKLVRPENVRRVYEFPYRRAGIEVLGHGYTATAILGTERYSVIKLMRGTDRLDEDERDELVQAIDRKIEPNRIVHPEVALPTSITIGLSPIRHRPTVQILQPFVRRSLNEADPREVQDFAEKSLDEMKPEGYLPDVNGWGNLINTEDGIRLIDTVAIPDGGEEAGTFLKCIKILEHMAHTGSTSRKS